MSSTSAPVIGANPELNHGFENGTAAVEDYHSRFTASDREAFKRVDEVLDWMKLPKNATVLDVGAGTGIYVEHLAKRAAKIYAVDTSPNFIAHLKKRKEERLEEWKHVEIVHSEQERVPLPDAVADFIISVDTYHHFTNVGAMMTELRRLLKPTGRMIFLDYLKDFSEWTKGHVRASKEQAIQEITSNGFSIADEFSMNQNWCIAFRKQ